MCECSDCRQYENKCPSGIIQSLYDYLGEAKSWIKAGDMLSAYEAIEEAQDKFDPRALRANANTEGVEK